MSGFFEKGRVVAGCGRRVDAMAGEVTTSDGCLRDDSQRPFNECPSQSTLVKRSIQARCPIAFETLPYAHRLQGLLAMKTGAWTNQGLVLLVSTNLVVTACNRSGTTPLQAPVESAVATHDGTGVSGCQPTRATGKTPTIDDFETDPARTLFTEGRGGWWFQYEDGTGGKLVREEIRDDSRVLHVTASGFTGWGVGFGATLVPATTRTSACGYDASMHSGIRFRARGHGQLRLVLMSMDNLPEAAGGRCTREKRDCYDGPGVSIALSEQWQTYEQPFCALVREGWGGDPAGLNRAELTHIQFRIDAWQDFEMWMDDLAFSGIGPKASQPKCTRPCPLEAVPPGAKVDPAFTTAKLTDELTLHTFQQSTTRCGTLARRYLSFVPKRLGRASSAPVLMVLHGSSANAESMQDYMTRGRFDELASRDGFVVVYGNAAPGTYTNPSPKVPNTGVWRQGELDDGDVDDVAYLLDVLDDLKARGIISGKNAVYLTGLSNGGGMVLKAAKQAPERFRGIAPVMAYDSAKPLPVPDLRGKGLNRVCFIYSRNDPGLPKDYANILGSYVQEWAAGLGVPRSQIDNPKRTELPDRAREGDGYGGESRAARSTLDSRATEYDIVDPGSQTRLRTIVLDHGGHFWPNPGGETAAWAIQRWGFRNQDFDASDLIWEFFSRDKALP